MSSREVPAEVLEDLIEDCDSAVAQGSRPRMAHTLTEVSGVLQSYLHSGDGAKEEP